MSGLAWIILNIALVIGAAYGTVKVRNTPAPNPLQLEEPAKSEEESQHKTSARNEKPAESKLSASRPLAANAPMDDLWKQTLFLPTRTEDTGEDNAEQANLEQAAMAARNIEFELVGIAQINVVGEEDPVPVAILRSKIGAERGGRGTPRRGGPPSRDRNPRNNQPQPSNPAADSQAKSEEKQVFRVGEKINQTGYLLVDINAKEKMVEVSRNGETVKLYINFIGEEATQRREAVSQATAKKHQEQARRIEQENRERQQAAQAAQTQEAPTQPASNANPGGPPAPPGAPANRTSPDSRAANATGPASPDARAERLRRIAEARQQQQARQQQNANTPANNQNQNAAPPPPPPGE